MQGGYNASLGHMGEQKATALPQPSPDAPVQAPSVGKRARSLPPLPPDRSAGHEDAAVNHSSA